MSVVPYDDASVDAIATTLNLRLPNRNALDAIARELDARPEGSELVADLATGVGKTYIAGGLLDYLYEAGVRNVVIVTPGSTIQRKTVANLTPGSPPAQPLSAGDLAQSLKFSLVAVTCGG